MANIPLGTRHEQTLLVTSEIAIDFMGLEGPRVLSTPHMIGYMERTCRDAVLPLLEPGYDTVGTHVLQVPLNAGDNTFVFSNPTAYGPDLDAILL